MQLVAEIAEQRTSFASLNDVLRFFFLFFPGAMLYYDIIIMIVCVYVCRQVKTTALYLRLVFGFKMSDFPRVLSGSTTTLQTRASVVTKPKNKNGTSNAQTYNDTPPYAPSPKTIARRSNRNKT